MRISAIAPVGSSTAAPVDPVRWHDDSGRIRRVEAHQAERARKFQDVIERLQEQPHRRRTRVMEVVSAPGIRSGPVHVDRDYYAANQ